MIGRFSCLIHSIYRKIGQVNRIIDTQSVNITVVAAHEDRLDLAVRFGIGIETVDGVVLGSFRNGCRCGYTDHAVLLKEAYRIQLVFALVLCFVALLLL